MHQNFTEKPDFRLLRGEYIGTESRLYGLEAQLLVKSDPDSNQSLSEELKAQFDDISTGLGHGWHVFKVSQFEIDWASDSSNVS